MKSIFKFICAIVILIMTSHALEAEVTGGEGATGQGRNTPLYSLLDSKATGQEQLLDPKPTYRAPCCTKSCVGKGVLATSILAVSGLCIYCLVAVIVFKCQPIMPPYLYNCTGGW